MQRITLKASWLTGVAYTCNPSSIKKWEETGKGVQGHIQPYSKFEVSLGYTGVYVCVSVCVRACTCAWCVHKKLKKRRKRIKGRRGRKEYLLGSSQCVMFWPLWHQSNSHWVLKIRRNGQSFLSKAWYMWHKQPYNYCDITPTWGIHLFEAST